jgi:hypothetical protein
MERDARLSVLVSTYHTRERKKILARVTYMVMIMFTC